MCQDTEKSLRIAVLVGALKVQRIQVGEEKTAPLLCINKQLAHGDIAAAESFVLASIFRRHSVASRRLSQQFKMQSSPANQHSLFR